MLLDRARAQVAGPSSGHPLEIVLLCMSMSVVQVTISRARDPMGVAVNSKSNIFADMSASWVNVALTMYACVARINDHSSY